MLTTFNNILSVSKIILTIGLLSVLISCSGPIRFASKEHSPSNGISKSDSLRIVRGLNSEKDSSLRFANDVEFTDEEIRESENEIPEHIKVDVNELIRQHSRMDTLNSIPTSYERMIMQIINYLGTPYKFGGNSRKGIDCSAFTQTMISEVFNLEIPRSTLGQIKIGNEVRREELEFGDLIFFNTRRRQVPGHVGIYLWDQYFAHASTKHGVVISSMESGYYDRKFIAARRIEEVFALTR
ncbi:MAG: NlpC/P60 family protein [Bacteroidota bacterium]